MPALLVENTPAEIRCTAISAGFNVSCELGLKATAPVKAGAM